MDSLGGHSPSRKDAGATHGRGASPNRAPDDYDRALGAAIRLRRRALGVSQEQLAAACGISFQQVQKYENGSNRVSFSRLVRIAHALETRVSDLTIVLDQPQGAGSDLEVLRLMNLPGAAELLKRYDALAPDVRPLLVGLLEKIAAPQA